MTYRNPTLLNLIIDASVILISLKLLNLVNLPWIWILSPIWISISIFATIACILTLLAIIEVFTK